MGTTTEKLTYLQGTKDAIKNAIVAKGVAVPEGTTFRGYAEKVGEIPTGAQVETVKIKIEEWIKTVQCEIAIIEMTEEGILIAKKMSGHILTADTKILKNSIVYCTAYTLEMLSGSRYLNVTGDHEKVYEYKDDVDAYIVFIIKGDCTIS